MRTSVYFINELYSLLYPKSILANSSLTWHQQTVRSFNWHHVCIVLLSYFLTDSWQFCGYQMYFSSLLVPILVWSRLRVLHCMVIEFVEFKASYRSLHINLSEWVSDCCLTPIQQFVSYMMARTSLFSMRWWWGALCTRQTRWVGFL